jgi:hypothetical protein
VIQIDITIENIMEWANGLDHPISVEDAHAIVKKHGSRFVDLAMGIIQDEAENRILDCDRLEDPEDDDRAEDAKEDA